MVVARPSRQEVPAARHPQWAATYARTTHTSGKACSQSMIDAMTLIPDRHRAPSDGAPQPALVTSTRRRASLISHGRPPSPAALARAGH